MSDLSFSPEPASSSSRKRNSKGSGSTQANKKPQSFRLLEDEESTRDMFMVIAQYTKSLQGSVAGASQTRQDAPPPKTPEQIQAEVLRIKSLIVRRIKKLMSWKPSCKYVRVKYAFDGVCPDPRVFGTMFRLNGPLTWRAKKYTCSEFENFVGEIEGHARYSYLVLTSDVNVRYNPETSEFRVSGSYGDPQSQAARSSYTHPLFNLGGPLIEPGDAE